MNDWIPPVISLRQFRTCQERFEERTSSVVAPDHDSQWSTVKKIEESLKRFGCVCIPLSDIDEVEVSPNFS